MFIIIIRYYLTNTENLDIKAIMPDNKIHGNSSTHPRWQPADVSRTEDLHRDKKLF